MINEELIDILLQEGFVEGDSEDSEIVYELEHSLDDRIGVLIYIGYSIDDKPLHSNTACKVVLFDYDKQRTVGRSTRIKLQLNNWRERLRFEINKFVDIVILKRWKKCAECGEPMRFLPTSSGDFWGCNGYISLGVGCQNKEAYDPPERVKGNRKFTHSDREIGRIKTRPRLQRTVDY